MNFKNNRNLSLSIVLTLLACVIALAFRLFSEHDLPFQVFAAIIGVIITAIITQVLLNGQSEVQEKLLQQQKDIELDREIQAKRYEEKLRIYQEFLQKLCDVVKDGVVTKEEARELQFQTAYITMHTAPERIEKISQCVKTIIEDTTNFVDSGEQEGEVKAGNAEADILKNLFIIVEEFKSVLYEKEACDIKKYEEAIKNFNYIIDAIDVAGTKQSESIIPENSPSEGTTVDSIKNLNDFADELEKKLALDNTGWKLQRGNMKDGIYVNLTMKDAPTPNFARVMLNHDSDGKHYFQIHLEYDDTHEAYKHMKWKWGGRQNKWSWWNYLDGDPKNLAKPEYLKQNWEASIESIAKCLSEQMDYVATFVKVNRDIRKPLKSKLGERANVWMWYAHVVAVDYKDSLFFDIVNKDDTFLLMMGNRNADNEELEKRRRALQLPEKALNEEGKYIIGESFSAQEVIEQIKTLDKKI